MEDLPESLLAEIVKRITRRCDLNSLSLVSKQLYTIDESVGQQKSPSDFIFLPQKGFDPSYDAHNPSTYDFCCDSLKDLRLARMTPGQEIGLRVLLGKCKALEKLWLEYVTGLNDNDMIALSRSCSNLRSISLWLSPQFYDYSCRTSFTDDSLKALAISCPMLQAVELTFFDCDPCWPSEIGFTLEGLLVLIKSCPVSVLVLNGANFFNDEGMEAISSAPFLETLELVDCVAITDAGMRFVTYTPCLTNLTLRLCNKVTDSGVAELGRAHKLQCLIIEGCEGISEKAVQGAARSVHYSIKSASCGELKRVCKERG
ncbi:F-box/LRR-repeat protein 14-like [Brachypodium distachyon]|uniref:F-box/LRR-repeat protein 14-like n=1 Tax=Brachypodium distachyon TaxID=15368 RepID=UPI000D0CD09E|nr:F-box/LRR-repeat protein 14-like [Brachypodium distachyon]|eukprot:XP_024318990.1 F-box/LRR-repeat protein 14-like [Brachypodium distachyon]